MDSLKVRLFDHFGESNYNPYDQDPNKKGIYIYQEDGMVNKRISEDNSGPEYLSPVYNY